MSGSGSPDAPLTQRLFLLGLSLVAIVLTAARTPDQNPLQATGFSSRASDPVQLAEEETVEGFRFLRSEVGGNVVRWQPDIPADNIAMGIRAIEIGSTRVPELMGVSGRALDFYLLRDSDQLQWAVIRVGSADRVSGNVSGVSIGSGARPGIYVDTSAFKSAGRALVIISHEIAHQVIRDTLRNRPVPAWFDEGIATLVGVSVAMDADSDYGARYMFVSAAILANGSRAGAIPPLTQLVVPPIWNAEADRLAGLPYDAALFGFRRLVQSQGFPAIVRVLERVAEGQAFNVAFTVGLGESPGDFENKLFDLTALLASELPSGLQSQTHHVDFRQPLQFIYPGLEPGELLDVEFTGPLHCREQREERADALGFATFQFTGPTDADCLGDWYVTVRGGSGTEDTTTFSVTDAARHLVARVTDMVDITR